MSSQKNPSTSQSSEHAAPKESKPKEYLISDQQQKFLDLPLLWKILKIAQKHKVLGIVTFFILISSQILPFVAPHLLEKIIDVAIPSGEFSQIMEIIILYFFLIVLQAILMFLATYMAKTLAFNVIHELRVKLFHKVTKMKMEFFHRTPVGRLMTRMTSDVDSLNSLFSEGLLDLLSSVFMLIFAMVFMFYKNWQLALTTTLVFPAMVIITSIFRVKVRNINRIIREKVASLNSILQENLNGINMVQIFNKEKQRAELFDDVNQSYKEAYIKNVWYYSLFFPGIFSLTDLSLIALYAVGVNLVMDGSTSVGMLVAFAWYASMFQRPLREISDKITQLQSSIAAGERVFTLMETDAEDANGEIQLDTQNGIEIEFKNLKFGYDPKTPVLKGVDFKIHRGQRIAIVGATGSGKTTIMNLLNRFYRTTDQQILINGTPLNELDRNSLKGKLAYVSQDVFLFSDTIRSNITLDNEMPEEQIWQILDQVSASSFVKKLPDGLDTILRDNGSNLSSGQRQLISFARAIAQDPELLLLDEATSSIDTDTEELIQEALETVLQGRTSIVVAHRLSTIVNSDLILVFHHGEIRESGNHEDLIQQDGIYSQLVKLNNLGFA